MSSKTVMSISDKIEESHRLVREALVIASLHKEISLYHLTVYDIDQMSLSLCRILIENGYCLQKVTNNGEH